MYRVDLDPFFTNCPKWWQNFVNNIPPYDAVSLTVDEIQDRLSNIDSTFHSNPTGKWIEFKNVNTYNWFVLKWS